jgi:hypothetical protein
LSMKRQPHHHLLILSQEQSDHNNVQHPGSA